MWAPAKLAAVKRLLGLAAFALLFEAFACRPQSGSDALPPSANAPAVPSPPASSAELPALAPKASASASFGSKLLLGAFTLAQVREAARGAEAGRGATLEWGIAEWAGRPDAIVALSYLKRPLSGPPKTALKAEIALLERQAGALVKVASGAPPLSNANCDDTSGAETTEPSASLRLDLAPYQLTDAERAIGLRLHCHNAFPAGEGEETRLYLLRVNKASLEEVFDAEMDSSSEQRGPNDQIEASAILMVQSSKSKGVFDLLLRRKIKISPLDPGSDPGRKPKNETKLERYAWDGRHYQKLPARP